MEKAKAAQIVKTIIDAQAATDAAVSAMGIRVSQDAADLCFVYLTDASVHVGLRLVAQLWEEFPDLTPERADSVPFMRCRVPAAEMAPVRKALADLIRAVAEARELVQEGASTPGERLGYLTVLTETESKLQEVDAHFAELEA